MERSYARWDITYKMVKKGFMGDGMMFLCLGQGSGLAKAWVRLGVRIETLSFIC